MTLSITAAGEMGSSPRVRLVIASSVSGPLPVQPGSVVRVDRIHEDGQRFRVILEADARLGSGSWAGFDYHAPFNQPVTYVALVSGQESAASGPAYQLSEHAWLIHPTDPSKSLSPFRIAGLGERGAETNSASFDVYGSAYPVALSSGVRKAVAGELTLSVPSEDQPLYVDLLEASGAIQLNTPASQGWDLGSHWILPGRITYTNLGVINSYPYRQIAFPYQIVAQPAVDTTPEWTWAKMAATYATFGAVRDAYVDGNALKLDARS